MGLRELVCGYVEIMFLFFDNKHLGCVFIIKRTALSFTLQILMPSLREKKKKNYVPG